METIEGNTISTEALFGSDQASENGGGGPVVAPTASAPTNPPHTTLNPTPEELFGTEIGSENGTGGPVVVTTTVIEKTEVTVVKIVEETKDDAFLFQEGEEPFADSVTEKKEHNNDAKENEKGGIGHLFDLDEGMDVNFNNEAKENEKEGSFNHLFDGDDAMNVDYNKENEKEGGFDHLFDGDEGINVNFTENGNDEKLVINDNEENASGDLMDVCLSDQKEENPQNPKNSTEVFDFKDEMTNEEINENNGGKLAETEEEFNESESEEEPHDFVVGDFVWGKIKSHPWWPGQIYDPSDASEYANSIKRKGHLLVAYFGDGSFSWCSPSQLKPFIDNFQEMSNQSDSKKFVHAVRTALEAVSHLVESELTCKCVIDRVDRVAYADVANSGIKPGARVPRGNTIKTLVEKMTPGEVLLALSTYATCAPDLKSVELEVIVVKSWLSAFYFKKGGYLLPEYSEGKCIEGLEDKVNVPETDKNGPENGDDKLYQKRKQKSVAELLEGTVAEDDVKIKKGKTVKDGGSGRKRKAALVVEVPPESDNESGGGGGAGLEDDMASPRYRKKSKYLSPPYLSPVGRLSGSGSFKEPKPEKLTGSGSFKEPKPEVEKEKVPEPLEEGSRKKPRQKRRAREGSNEQDGKNGVDAGVNVDKMLNGLLLAALDPSGSAKKLGGVTRFVSNFRSSVFENGEKVGEELKEDVEMETEVGFVKRKIEEMREVVSGCEEGEMGGEVKGRLEVVLMEVLERVK